MPNSGTSFALSLATSRRVETLQSSASTTPSLQQTAEVVQSVVSELHTSFRVAAMNNQKRGHHMRDELPSTSTPSTQGAVAPADGDDATLLEHLAIPIDVCRHGADWLFLHEDVAAGEQLDTRMLSLEALHRQLGGILVAWIRSCSRWAPTAVHHQRRHTTVKQFLPDYLPLHLHWRHSFGIASSPPCASIGIFNTRATGPKTIRTLCGPADRRLVVRHLAMRVCANLVSDNHRHIFDRVVASTGSLTCRDVLFMSPQVWVRQQQDTLDGIDVADDVWCVGMNFLVALLGDHPIQSLIGCNRNVTEDDDDIIMLRAIMHDEALLHVQSLLRVPTPADATVALYRLVERLRQALLATSIAPMGDPTSTLVSNIAHVATNVVTPAILSDIVEMLHPTRRWELHRRRYLEEVQTHSVMPFRFAPLMIVEEYRHESSNHPGIVANTPSSRSLEMFLTWRTEHERRSVSQTNAVSIILVKQTATYTAWIELLWSMLILGWNGHGDGHHPVPTLADAILRRQEVTTALLQSFPSLLIPPAVQSPTNPHTDAAMLFPPTSPVGTTDAIIDALAGDAAAFLCTVLESHMLQELSPPLRRTSTLVLPAAVLEALWRMHRVPTADEVQPTGHLTTLMPKVLLSTHSFSPALEACALDPVEGASTYRRRRGNHQGSTTVDTTASERLIRSQMTTLESNRMQSLRRSLLALEDELEAHAQQANKAIANMIHKHVDCMTSSLWSDTDAEALVAPPLRGLIWRALLAREALDSNSALFDDDIPFQSLSVLEQRYSSIDVDAPTCNDRQIAVDIPRCHQYEPFLASTVGHNKIFRIVKAWLAMHPTMLYWQGVDSVCAVLLYTTGGEEALTAGLLSMMMKRWVPHFFLRGAQGAMEHRLLQLTLLLRYFDPLLAAHVFDRLECKPELFAVPWFLTLFAHVLPVRKCQLVWDFLITRGSPDAILCVACAVLLEQRELLLHASDFASAVAHLTALASLDVMHLITEASALLQLLPPSALRPDFSDPVTASLTKSSCCTLMSAADVANLRRPIPNELATASKWADHGGVILVDTRTSHEFGRTEVMQDGDREGGNATTMELRSILASHSVQHGGAKRPLHLVLGAVHVPFEASKGWIDIQKRAASRAHDGRADVDSSDGSSSLDGDPDGEPLLKLLSQQHHLWYHPRTTQTATREGQSRSLVTDALDCAPTIVVLADKEPEDGQGAVESLQQLGIPKVAMLLGGITKLRGCFPECVVEF